MSHVTAGAAGVMGVRGGVIQRTPAFAPRRIRSRSCVFCAVCFVRVHACVCFWGMCVP